jgi:DNA-directed RNA polymerase specialized sigma24 family protein
MRMGDSHGETPELLKRIPPKLRRVYLLHAEGFSNAEIAWRIDRPERSVEIMIQAIRAIRQRPEGGEPS